MRSKSHHFKVKNRGNRHYLMLKHCRHSQIKPVTKQTVPGTCSLQPWATNLLFVSVDLTVLDISQKWNHAICVLLGLASLAQRMFSRLTHIVDVSTLFLSAAAYPVFLMSEVFWGSENSSSDPPVDPSYPSLGWQCLSLSVSLGLQPVITCRS